MDQTTQVELIRRLQGYEEASTTGMSQSVTTNDIDTYLSPEQFAKEKALLFRNYPILITQSSQVRNPGDFVTHNDTGVPLLVVRGRDGRLNAFMNVCKHRGAKVALEASGNVKKGFLCPFHAWNFDLDGRLQGIPDSFAFDTLKREQHSLVRLPVAEAYGTVWVRPSPGPELDLPSFLGGVHPELANFGTEQWVHYRTIEMRKKMNWKLMMDAFMEFYHFRFLHKNTLADFFLSNITAFDPMGDHFRIVGANHSIMDLQSGQEAEWQLRDHALILYLVFPNTAFIHVKDHVITLTVFPGGGNIDEALVRMSFLIPKAPATALEEQHWATQADLLERVTEEDFAMGEDIQFGLGSGALERTVYGKVEPALNYFHSTVRRVLGQVA